MKGFEDCSKKDWIEFTLWILSWMVLSVIFCGIALLFFILLTILGGM